MYHCLQDAIFFTFKVCPAVECSSVDVIILFGVVFTCADIHIIVLPVIPPDVDCNVASVRANLMNPVKFSQKSVALSMLW